MEFKKVYLDKNVVEALMTDKRPEELSQQIRDAIVVFTASIAYWNSGHILKAVSDNEGTIDIGKIGYPVLFHDRSVLPPDGLVKINGDFSFFRIFNRWASEEKIKANIPLSLYEALGDKINTVKTDRPVMVSENAYPIFVKLYIEESMRFYEMLKSHARAGRNIFVHHRHETPKLLMASGNPEIAP